jgi:predicted lipoprotein with Yx(FWY)xxD motif
MRLGYRLRPLGPAAGRLPLVGLIGLLSACGAATAITATPSPTPTPVPPAHVAAATTALGAVLTNAAGYTLYYFMPEQGSKLVCASGACASTWPLVTSGGSPVAGAGVTGQLGTVPGPGGSVVVTYAGWPLHHYSGDTAPGQTNGQGIGGKWFAAIVALTPTGPPTPPPTPTPTPTTVPPAAATARPMTAPPATAPPATAPPTAPPSTACPTPYPPYC